MSFRILSRAYFPRYSLRFNTGPGQDDNASGSESLRNNLLSFARLHLG